MEHKPGRGISAEANVCMMNLAPWRGKSVSAGVAANTDPQKATDGSAGSADSGSVRLAMSGMSGMGGDAIIAADNRKVNQNQSRVRHLSHKGKKILPTRLRMPGPLCLRLYLLH